MIRRVAAALLPALALGAAAGPADAQRKSVPGKAKAPTIKRVAPQTAQLGQTLTITGRHFRTGHARNRVGFRAPGQPVVYLTAGRSTSRTIRVRLTSALARVVGDAPRAFRLRVVTSRFGRYTAGESSPTIGPVGGTTGADRPPPTGAAPGATGPAVTVGGGEAATPPASCVPGGGDRDGDGLADAVEVSLGTSACAADTDGDGVEDGYEFRSAVDLNDDAYQSPDTALPHPGEVPYPNPLDGADADYDFDGDLLTMRDEFRLWQRTTAPERRSLADVPPRATPLSYSDGLQDSRAVRCPAAGPDVCDPRDAGRTVSIPEASFDPFYAWARRAGYATVLLDKVGPYAQPTGARRPFDIRDLDLSGTVEPVEENPLDYDTDGLPDDGERDGDADGLSNYDELHGRLQPAYWSACYASEPDYGLPYTSTDPLVADTDGDGVRDGADDADRDEYPNLMELSRIRAHRADAFANRGPWWVVCVPGRSPAVAVADSDTRYGWVQPFNPCMPSTRSPRCSEAYVAGSMSPTWTALQ